MPKPIIYVVPSTDFPDDTAGRRAMFGVLAEAQGVLDKLDLDKSTWWIKKLDTTRHWYVDTAAKPNGLPLRYLTSHYPDHEIIEIRLTDGDK